MAAARRSLGNLSNHIDEGNERRRHKFAYLTTKNNCFARFARAFFVFSHFADVLVLSTTRKDLFCSCARSCENEQSLFQKLPNLQLKYSVNS